MESDQENIDIVEEGEVQIEEPVKVDKRKISSKINMEKARLKKLANQKQEKQLKGRTYNVYDESPSDSESDEDDQLILTRKPSKQKAAKNKSSKEPKHDKSELSELKQMMTMLMAQQLKAKKKKPAKKQINLQLPAIYAQNPPPQKAPNQKLKHLTQQLIDL